MQRENEPMPLSDLPDYMRSVRENGQSDYAPVVQMGRIVANKPSVLNRALFYSGAACLLFALGGLYVASETKEMTIVAEGTDARTIAARVENEGGRVMSVKKGDGDTYRVKVFSRSFGSLVDRLRGDSAFKKVDPSE